LYNPIFIKYKVTSNILGSARNLQSKIKIKITIKSIFIETSILSYFLPNKLIVY